MRSVPDGCSLCFSISRVACDWQRLNWERRFDRKHRGDENDCRIRGSKGVIAQLTKMIALEYGQQGIRANAIDASVIETDILNGIVEDSRATLASYGHLHALQRVGQPEGIAQNVAWLASPRFSFVTGALVMAYGGYTPM